MSTDFSTSHGHVTGHGSTPQRLVLLLTALLLIVKPAVPLSDFGLSQLRQDTSYLFYHGFDGYMKYAFPDDELRPVTCGAFTRDSSSQNHWELNDPLGNYSLTLIDSLSTLAILASSSQSKQDRKKALNRFQDSVRSVIDLYGDGSDGPTGEGQRARGFDIDSKVQVFETAIRGLGGLLSAHLFAVGELPIRDYEPHSLAREDSTDSTNSTSIRWSRHFSYNGQLLRLAHDLGRRLLPAFSTQTGIPYPRVNLKHGIPFYYNAPQNCGVDADKEGYGFNGQCPAVPQTDGERTETCSAGAGSLVLEFSTLSRLTGDVRFEKLAKRAFWAVWYRRMPTGLVGSGIDAETGEWKGPPLTGIGAGVDSFYEYAVKSYILLSSTDPFPNAFENTTADRSFEPAPLSAEEEDSDSFLATWQASQQAIRRHIYHGENSVHPHYTQVNLYNAAQQANWIDSLSAFYSGSLVLAGHVDEASVTHLLFTALWARYSALPERWSTATGDIEHGLPWWPGRPEFIESAYYLYQATKDPWYVHVGEMTLRDIKRRCWTPCGWAGLQDVRTGELTDRMESFFLGETVKYLHLLFDPDHPMNKLDAPWVFSTEGHPLVIPKEKARQAAASKLPQAPTRHSLDDMPTCPAAPSPLPLTVSHTAARPDLFHAAALARLHWATNDKQQESALLQASDLLPGISLDDIRSPTNYTFYPWTLPRHYVPPTGTCAPISEVPTFHITFPTPSALIVNAPNHRTMKGIFMNSLAGIRLSMIQDLSSGEGSLESFRVNAINNQPIGRDEQLFVTRDTFASIVTENDPNFYRVRDPAHLQLVFDIPIAGVSARPTVTVSNQNFSADSVQSMADNLAEIGSSEQKVLMEALARQANTAEGALASAIRYLAEKVSSKLSPVPSATPEASFNRNFISAIMASGTGAAPLPHVADAAAPDPQTGKASDHLIWRSVYHAGQLCGKPLQAEVVQQHQVLVLMRGGCSFSRKLENIPSFAPSKSSLQLVVLVNESEERAADQDLTWTRVGEKSGTDDEEAPGGNVRPKHMTDDILRDEEGEGEEGEEWEWEEEEGDWPPPPANDFSFRPVLDRQQRTPSGLLRRHPIPMIMVEGGKAMYEMLERATALGIRRRYTVQAQGVPISNVHIL